MASPILGLKGLSKSSGLNTLVAAYGNGFVNAANGVGYGIPITPNMNVEFDVFLESLFFQNYSETPLTFNGTTWSRQHVSKVPLSKYIKQWNERMYLGYVKIGSQEFPSRVMYSDLPKNNTIQWGYEQGSTLQTIAGSPVVRGLSTGFSTFGIKRGDPLFILSGADAGEYVVDTVVSDTQLLLTKSLTATATGLSFWVGGNWFDVLRDDGDFVTWIDENDNQLTVYKRDSLHRYNGQSRIKIKDAKGTTSGRSVINLHELSLYFHGSSGFDTGFYAYDGRDSVKISGPIEKHIAGINSSMYTTIAAWREGDLYRAYVGNINNTNYDIVIPKAVCTWDYNTHAWSVDPIADDIQVATEFRQSGVKQTYLGTSDAQVLLTPSGNSFNNSPIPWKFRTKVFWPSGTEIVNTFPRLEIISENAKGIRVGYKRHLNPFNTDEEFTYLGQLDNEKTIFDLPEDKNLFSGIQLEFDGIDTKEANAIIKKITIYYRRELTNLR